MTVFKPGPKARTFNYQAGDVGYVPVVKYPGFEMPSANRTPQNVKYFKNFDYKVKNPPCNAAKEH